MESHLILAYMLVVLGLLLMAAELFLLAHGFALVLGIGAMIVGIAMVFNTSGVQGMVTLVAVCVLIPLLGPLVLYYWPKTALGKRFVLTGADDDTMANMPVNLELEQLRGRYGKTVSPLRPSGITEFDGRRIDTMSEGPMIDPGVWVRCIEVKTGRVVVRQVAKPPDLADMDTGEFGA